MRFNIILRYQDQAVLLVFLLRSTLCHTDAGTPADTAVHDLVSDFWDWQMYMNPSISTNYGITEYNGEMERYGLQQFDIQRNKTLELMDRLDAINPDNVTTQSINYKMLKDALQTFLDGNEWARYGAINPIFNFGGIHMYDKPFMLPSANTYIDYRNYIKRLLAVQSQVDGLKEMMRYAIQTNRTLHNVTMSNVLPTIDTLIFDTPEESPLYKTVFVDQLTNSSLEATLKDELLVDGRNAVQAYMDAFRDLKAFLSDEYLPNTRKDVGVWAVDPTNGFYKACLNFHLSLEMDPADVHALGISEVNSITTKMNETMKQLGFEGTRQEFFDSLKNNSRFYTNNATELLQAFNDTIFKTIRPKLDGYFSDIPHEPLIVMDAGRSGFTAAYFRVTDTTPGRFVVNLLRPNETSNIVLLELCAVVERRHLVKFMGEIMALCLHEAFPGHHLQFSYTLRTNLPDFRKNTIIKYSVIPNLFPFYTANIEGWGLYSEYLGEEMGLYMDGYSLIGRYNLEILRACRLVVDTGIHYMRWNRSRAIDYFQNCTSWSQTAVEYEIDRYISLPGQACAYKIGEIKIRQLREMAEKQLGSNFDIKAFHRVILINGPMSLNLLDTLVNDWVEDELIKLINAAPTSRIFSIHSMIWLAISVGTYSVC